MSGAVDRRLADLAGAAAILAVDPIALGGAVLHAGPGPLRDAFLDRVRSLLPAGTPWRRLPAAIGDDRLIGGLDLSATLAGGKPVARRGLLAEADGGVVVAAMAERMEGGTAAKIAAVLDQGAVAVERDGFGLRQPARIAVLALDEGLDADERPPAALIDRLALILDLNDLPSRAALPPVDAEAVTAARGRLATIVIADETIAALCETAAALGVDTLRASIQSVAVARASAALVGRDHVAQEDAARAAQLVLAPRATRMPPGRDEAPPEPPEEQEPPPPPPDAQSDEAKNDQDLSKVEKLADVILAAAQAAIPEKLLAGLVSAAMAGAKGAGRAGALGKSALRGRPIGARRGALRPGARLSVVDTLRAAAPWQALRRRERTDHRLIEVRAEDFQIKRFKQHAETTTIFVVDASGSAALNRLAEAKGAVELLLADCYVRRDRVALIAFRGTQADLVLPPTRALVRAKRSLAGLAGGGGTPLALAIDAALVTAREQARRGQTPVMVFLTDGRANIDRAGHADRAQAQADALTSARLVALARVKALVIDTSPRPQPAMRDLAAAMQATYVALPHTRAEAISDAVRLASGAAG